MSSSYQTLEAGQQAPLPPELQAFIDNFPKLPVQVQQEFMRDWNIIMKAHSILHPPGSLVPPAEQRDLSPEFMAFISALSFDRQCKVLEALKILFPNLPLVKYRGPQGEFYALPGYVRVNVPPVLRAMAGQKTMMVQTSIPSLRALLSVQSQRPQFPPVPRFAPTQAAVASTVSPAPAQTSSRKRRQPEPVSSDAGNHPVVTFTELSDKAKKFINEEFFVRLKALVMENATVSPAEDRLTRELHEYKSNGRRNPRFNGRKIRVSLTYSTESYTKIIKFDDESQLKVIITPRKIFRDQEYLKDPNCSSWVDLTDESDSEVYFEVEGYPVGGENPPPRILKCFIRQSEIDEEFAKKFPHFREPKESSAKKQRGEESKESLADKHMMKAELHTVDVKKDPGKEEASKEKKESTEEKKEVIKPKKDKKLVSGSNLTRAGMLFNHGVFKARTMLVDVSNLDGILMRLIFAIAKRRTWYQGLIPNLQPVKAKIKTPWYGELDQDPERRMQMLDMICQYPLEDWWDGFQEQKQDASLALDSALPKLIKQLRECKDAELSSVVKQLSFKSTESLIDSKLEAEIEKFSKKLEIEKAKLPDVSKQSRLEQKQASRNEANRALVEEYRMVRQYLKDEGLPDILFHLAKDHFFKDEKEEKLSVNPLAGKGITLQQLTAVILEASKKDPSKKPTPALRALFGLLTDGIKLRNDKNGQYYTKPLNPAKKLSVPREALCELIWRSLLWQAPAPVEVPKEASKVAVAPDADGDSGMELEAPPSHSSASFR